MVAPCGANKVKCNIDQFELADFTEQKCCELQCDVDKLASRVSSLELLSAELQDKNSAHATGGEEVACRMYTEVQGTVDRKLTEMASTSRSDTRS